ncbi:MAG: hypothetical protein WCA27_07375 [Candidatus Sulfotelmatobacter sp.]
MSKFMSPRAALVRVVEDESAPTKLRIQALEAISHPSLAMLRRLLVDTAKRVTPIPSKLKALATMAYVREIAFRKAFRKSKAKAEETQAQDNALGI